MDQSTKSKMMSTPEKDLQAVRSNASENSKNSENSNPNVTSPGPKLSTSSAGKTTKSHRSASRNPDPVFRNKIKERKFVVAKKKNPKTTLTSSNSDCKCKDKINGKCLCVAYESLKASQEAFFKSKDAAVEEVGVVEANEGGEMAERNVEIEKEDEPVSANLGSSYGHEPDSVRNGGSGNHEMRNFDCHPEEAESPTGTVFSTVKKKRDRLLEEARDSLPEPGSGMVMHLVKTFERLMSIPKESGVGEEKEPNDVEKGMKWPLPGLQERPNAPETQDFSSSFCPGNLSLTAEILGLESGVSSSWDSSHGRTSTGSRKSRRSSASFGTVGSRKWKSKQVKTTSLQPFKLRTEQRGRMKEEEFFKKLHEMMIEEERQRIPIAQGLPWTTDEPECLIKPPVKESTRPIDLKLHTDVRAVERAEFDQQVAEKLTLIEEYKMEREKQQKLAEEEEIRRLRKILIPKAQPMPYFDRPFVPRRSMKNPTIPREPKLHVPQHKKIKCLSVTR
ncbi:hypothetical protein Dimus_022086 [Dionaea muscipula]